MRRHLDWVCVALVALLVAHACGYGFAVGNQVTYFLHALQRAHPELFHNDWLVTSTNEYHALFGLLAGALYTLDDNGAVVFAIAHVVLMVATIGGVFLIARTALNRAALPVFLLVVGWIAVNGEHSIAGSYLWSSYLQPSLIGTASWIVALSLHLRGRQLATGCCLALGGLFHVNFLILGIGTFGLAEICAPEPRRLRRVLLLLAPQALALALVAPELVANAHNSDPSRSLWVLVQFHAPLHYKPSWIFRTLPSMLRWIALAFVVSPVAVEFGIADHMRRLLRWLLISALLCAGGTVFMMAPVFLPLTRLYVWRLAPFAIMAAQVVIAGAAAAAILDPSTWRKLPMWRAVTATILFVWISLRAPFMADVQGDWLLLISIGALVLSVLTRRRHLLLAIAGVATLAVPLWNRRTVIVSPSIAIASDGPETDALYSWARTTRTDATFMVPPDLGRFRLVARRACYADFKSPPLEPDALVAWDERLVRMTGSSPDDKVPTLRSNWESASGEDLLRRAGELGNDYLVLDRNARHDDISEQPIFENQLFAVFVTNRR